MNTTISPDLNRLLENVSDGVYFVDPARTITFWNKAAEQITGFSASEVVGHRCSENILTHVDNAGNNLCTGACPIVYAMKSGSETGNEVFLHHKNGQRIPVSVRVVPQRNEKGEIIGCVEIFSDISGRAALQQRISELEQLALVDKLTKLSNRHHTVPSLEAVFREKERYNLSFGVLMMDIDHFKAVNDTYGHDAGDAVLVMVAGTLRNAMRPFDHLGRWGGEEFLGIIRSVDEESLLAMAERCRVLVEKSYLTINDTVLRVTVSVGAAIAAAGDSADSLVKRADGLLYASKKAGRNRVTAG